MPPTRPPGPAEPELPSQPTRSAHWLEPGFSTSDRRGGKVSGLQTSVSTKPPGEPANYRGPAPSPPASHASDSGGLGHPGVGGPGTTLPGPLQAAPLPSPAVPPSSRDAQGGKVKGSATQSPQPLERDKPASQQSAGPPWAQSAARGMHWWLQRKAHFGHLVTLTFVECRLHAKHSFRTGTQRWGCPSHEELSVEQGENQVSQND